MIKAVEIDMMMTWLSPLDVEAPGGPGQQLGKEEAKQLADAGREYNFLMKFSQSLYML